MGDSTISANLRETADQHWEEGADLRHYALVLVSWWREMALLVLLGAFLAGAATWAAKAFRPAYEANAAVALLQPEAKTAFNTELPNVIALSSLAGDQAAHRATAERAVLLGLVRDGGVAAAVAERLGWNQGASPEASLLGAISAELVAVDPLAPTDSNLIRITASRQSPEDAKALANAWAEEYVNRVNLEYQRIAQSAIDALEQEMQQVASSHEAAQARVENALAQSRFGQLQRQIAANEQLIVALHDLAGKMATESDNAAAEGSAARRIAQLEEETRQLSMRKEREQAQLAKLVQARDSSLSILADLGKRQAELRLNLATKTPEVYLASRAVASSHPVGLSATLIGGTVAVILTPVAIFLAFFANALGLRSPLGRGEAEAGAAA